MGQLHERMAEDLRLRGLSPSTGSNYLLYCRKFAAFYMRSPEELGEAEIRRFLLHQIQVEELSHSTYRQILAALKFLYTTGEPRATPATPQPAPQRRREKTPRRTLAIFGVLCWDFVVTMIRAGILAVARVTSRKRNGRLHR